MLNWNELEDIELNDSFTVPISLVNIFFWHATEINWVQNLFSMVIGKIKVST